MCHQQHPFLCDTLPSGKNLGQQWLEEARSRPKCTLPECIGYATIQAQPSPRAGLEAYIRVFCFGLSRQMQVFQTRAGLTLGRWRGRASGPPPAGGCPGHRSPAPAQTPACSLSRGSGCPPCQHAPGTRCIFRFQTSYDALTSLKCCLRLHAEACMPPPGQQDGSDMCVCSDVSVAVLQGCWDFNLLHLALGNILKIWIERLLDISTWTPEECVADPFESY